ncbi:MAG: bifunctional diguanylate cyclase/phosphodiesterase [Magnetospiraceae bacterium]
MTQKQALSEIDPSGAASAAGDPARDWQQELRVSRETTALIGLLHSIAVAANQSDSLEAVIQTCLENVCAYTDWPVGHAYLVDPDTPGGLRSDGHWYLRTPTAYAAFQQATEQKILSPEQGTAPRVLAEGKPAWITSVASDSDHPRCAQAAEAGLRSGFCLPIFVEGITEGVLEFFSDKDEEIDQSLFYVLDQIGAVIGRVEERLRAHARLEESEHLKTSILRGALDGIVTFDGDGRVMDFNPAAQAMFSYTKAEVAGVTIGELFVPPEKRADHERGMAALRETGTSNMLNQRLVVGARRHDGTEFPLELSISQISAGKQPLYSAFLRDLTQQQKDDRHLRQLSKAVEQSPAAVIITDIHGNIEYVNHKFEDITGFASDEVIGRNPSFLKSDVTPQHVYEDMWRTLSAGGEWRGEFCNKRKDGSLFWEFAVISPIKDENGTVSNFVAVKEDISARKEQESRLLHQANYDALTDLPNRLLAMDRLNVALREARRDKTIVAVLFIDLDGFKKVNDTLGHEAGDKLLVEASRRMTDIVRNADTVARLGGDEFLIILGSLPNAKPAEVVADQLLTVLRDRFSLEGQEIFVSASIGITLYPEDSDDAQVLLRNADAAMYQAKEAGRSTYRFFTAAMNQQAVARLEMETQLRRALARGEFFLNYQPLFDAQTGVPVGAEALMRWNNDALGMVPPDQFIPLAEDMGIIVEIGDWLLETVCKKAREWSDRGHPLRLAVNISPRQFRDGVIVDQVLKVIRAGYIPANLLEIEVTEGLLLKDCVDPEITVGSLKDIGVRLSVDDFGTGYSSLSYLKQFQFDTLKIDKEFVSGVTTDVDHETLVRTIIAMARALGLSIIAEGVETEAQAEFLRAQGCDILQGYLFQKPMITEDFERWLFAGEY